MQSGSLQTEEGRSIAGTLAYMAPEQKEGKAIDPRSDLYACGIVLFELLAGSRPAGIEMPSSVRPDVPAFLDEAFRRCYARLEHRIGSAAELLEAVRGAGAQQTGASGGQLTCPSCHSSVHADDQFCIHCGYQLVDSIPRCGTCHAFLNRADRYCIFCGSKVQRGKE
jgi:serine/threonine protein kinase